MFRFTGNHHQGATVSTWLKITHLVKSRYIEAVHSARYTRLTVHNMQP